MTETSADRQQKHVALKEAMGAIDTLYRHAKGLLSDITLPPAEPEVSDPKNAVNEIAPSLESVLINAPDEIRNKCERVQRKLEEIRAAIF